MTIDESFVLTEEQVRNYFTRLEIVYDKDKWKPSEENLTILQNIHIAMIPYENLSILMKETISLNGNDLYDKIIVNHRGGYCFEVNGLFTHLLKALGYQVTVYNCRFIYENQGVQIRRHRIMKVDFEQMSYITDVSFRNESPRYALRFVCDEVQSDGIAEYKFTQDEYYGYVMWQKLTGQSWKKVFGFEESPQSETDFFLPNYFCETHPQSPFVDEPHMSICPENEHITIAGRKFVSSKKNIIVETRTINSGEEFCHFCKAYFGIVIDKKTAETILSNSN
ncbi:arylamine N-acetyltransferase family protein [Aminipila sp.]|uniref:arylamine N-acetyltransferase family protein n=1 Tax=Aminipila sp. TaxID=2060095 RepID=UPI0028A1183F|nr:arylamine N-acetyltransferase [Aminipila sp.]